jgi:16S rRNA (uracil1498-N3)-methyltransferase
MTRIFQAGPLAAGTVIALDAAASQHIARALRMRAGEPLTLFDGLGGEHAARIEALGKSVQVRILDRIAQERESPVCLTLVQALVAADKMDWVIQKAVELGASALQPVACERSVVRLEASREARRHAHWQRVALAACEQCGRNRVPQVLPVRAWREWCALPDPGTRYVLSPGAAMSLTGALRQCPVREALALAVGPEGGFTQSELALAMAHGVHAAGLGPRVLRTETAGLAALAIVQSALGDLA